MSYIMTGGAEREKKPSAIKEMLKNHPDKLWLDLTPDNYLELCINLIPDSLSS